MAWWMPIKIELKTTRRDTMAIGTEADHAAWIRAVAADLSAAGLDVGTNGDEVTGLDLTATFRPRGRSAAEIMLDEDGYAEIRWYASQAGAPAEVAAAMARILAAVAAPSAVTPQSPPAEATRPAA
jgi:hypothetical protein